MVWWAEYGGPSFSLSEGTETDISSPDPGTGALSAYTRFAENFLGCSPSPFLPKATLLANFFGQSEIIRVHQLRPCT